MARPWRVRKVGALTGVAAGRRLRLALPAALLLLAVPAPVGASAHTHCGLGVPGVPGCPDGSGSSPVSPPSAADDVVLSNETTRSQWAYIMWSVTARTEPRADAPPVRDARRRAVVLRPRVKYTESPNLVLLLEQTIASDGSTWVRARLPMRPNNTTGWLPRDSLGRFRLVTKRLVIDRRRFRASLYDRSGRRIWTSRIGIGIRKWPTPGGRFYVRERLVVPRGKARQMYGPFAFGTSALSPTLSGGNWGEGVIGVHGTGWPELIPGRVSHGCVRVYNSKIQQLRRLMGLGTPIRIL